MLEAAAAIEPDLVVASGDFTQRAKEEQFVQARAFLDRLPQVPTVVVPGNHDIPLWRLYERIFSPYRWYRKHIAEELDHVVEVEGAVVVALNSTAPLRAVTNGRIDWRQLELCRRAFENAPAGAVKIVVAHHHFAPAPDYEGGQVMPRAKRAIDVFNQLEVDLIMGGHLHRAYIGNSLDLYPGQDREHGITIVQSGTSTSRRGRVREREKNSFNVVRVGDEVVRVTHYMYFEDVMGFASASRHIFPRNQFRYFSDSVLVAGAGGA